MDRAVPTRLMWKRLVEQRVEQIANKRDLGYGSSNNPVSTASFSCQSNKSLQLYYKGRIPVNRIHRILTVQISSYLCFNYRKCVGPIPVAARSKAWVCGRSLAGNAGSNPAVDIGVCLL